MVASLIAACAREGVQQAAACQALAAAVRELNVQDAVSSRQLLLSRGLTHVCFDVARRSMATETLKLLWMSHDAPATDQQPVGCLVS